MGYDTVPAIRASTCAINQIAIPSRCAGKYPQRTLKGKLRIGNKWAFTTVLLVWHCLQSSLQRTITVGFGKLIL